MCRSLATSVGLFALLLVIVAAPTSATRGISWPSVPDGAVVAVATISPFAQNVTARGRVVLIAPKTGDATVAVNLTSGLANITMAHIHVTDPANNNPVILGLLPKLATRQLVQLDPPLSYRGTFWFVTTFNPDALVTGRTRDEFFALLGSGSLYVNVHTRTAPAGAVRGNLTCKSPCTYT